jgi:hypothetical protein
VDVIIEIIVFIIRALLGDNKKAKPQGSDLIERRLAEAREAQAAMKGGQRGPAQAPRTMTSAAQDPAFDDSGWRRVVIVFALTVLITMVAVWFLYVRGLLPSG